MEFLLKDLRQSNEFLNSVMDNITSAVFIVDDKARIHGFNNVGQILFNKSADALLNHLCGNAFGCYFTAAENKNCGETSFCSNCPLRKSIISAVTENVPSYKEILERKFNINGKMQYKYFQYTTKFVIYNNQKMILLIIDDITEMETNRKELQELNNVKNQFLGIAAHDLRNPLSAIMNFSEFLAEDLSDSLSEQHKEFLTLIGESSVFMHNLVEDLLDITKIEAGKLDLNKKNRDYKQFLEMNVKINKFIAENKKIELILKCPDDIGYVKFDENKLEQVINNLISNAVKFSEPGSRIEISAERKEERIFTYVKDFGVGISEEQRDKIFKPFETGLSSGTNGEKNTGLGLLITKKIVEGHNGEIDVKSELGKGSTFYFSLPLSKE